MEKPLIIKGTPVHCTINEYGIVWNLKTNREQKQAGHQSGYKTVKVGIGNCKYRRDYIHRLVAEHFIGPLPEVGMMINHIDGNTFNNHVSNLEWVTNSENQKHYHKELKNHNKYNCFECNSTVNIHHHHVVPRVKGGTKTIPLCMECHGKVHGDHMLKIQKLAWIGRQKKVKENLEKGIPSGLGRPFNTSETIEQFLNKPINVEIKRMVLEGYKVKDIMKSLTVSNKTVIKVRRFILSK